MWFVVETLCVCGFGCCDCLRVRTSVVGFEKSEKIQKKNVVVVQKGTAVESWSKPDKRATEVERMKVFRTVRKEREKEREARENEGNEEILSFSILGRPNWAKRGRPRNRTGRLACPTPHHRARAWGRNGGRVPGQPALPAETADRQSTTSLWEGRVEGVEVWGVPGNDEEGEAWASESGAKTALDRAGRAAGAGYVVTADQRPTGRCTSCRPYAQRPRRCHAQHAHDADRGRGWRSCKDGSRRITTGCGTAPHRH